jgi:hypothetical protein
MAKSLRTLGSDYTVTGAGNDLGGNVTLLVAYPATVIVTIGRATPLTQLLDLEYNDRLPAQLVEDALDQLTLITQELADIKSVVFPRAEPTDYARELPDAILRKGTVLGFDSLTGEAVLFETPLPVVPVTAPTVGTFILGAIDGVLQWVPTVNCGGGVS